jgi:hypothetical protein
LHPSNRDNKPKLQNKPRRQQNVNVDSVLTDNNLAKLCGPRLVQNQEKCTILK